MVNLTHQVLNIEDLRKMARRRLTKSLFEFCDKGSEDQLSMRDNRIALDNIKLMPRVLRDVSSRDPSVKLFDKRHDLPLLIAPTGPAGFVWYRGETELARAASSANIPFTLASTSNTPMEKILSDGGGTQWFQLYVWQDIDAALVTVQRAFDAGFEALVLTVDSPVYNNRESDIRNKLSFPPRVSIKSTIDALLHPRWLLGTVGRYILDEGHLPELTNIEIPEKHRRSSAKYTSGFSKSFLNRNDMLDWNFIRRLRDLWPRKLLLKGILHPEDAVLAADCGVDGIFVSNHAGNVNDTAITTWDALPNIVEAVRGRLIIIADTGIRRGSDVIKALALGADVVAIGRATLYGVAAAGESGATRAIEILNAEICRTMAVMGLENISSITRDHIRLPRDLPVSGLGN